MCSSSEAEEGTVLFPRCWSGGGPQPSVKSFSQDCPQPKTAFPRRLCSVPGSRIYPMTGGLESRCLRFQAMASSQDNSEGPSQFQTTWKLSHSSICPTLFYSPGHFAVYFKCISFLLKIFTYLFPFSGTGSLLLQAGFSLIAVSRGYCLLRSTGFSLPWLLWLQSTGCGHSGFEQFGLAGSRTQAQWW